MIKLKTLPLILGLLVLTLCLNAQGSAVVKCPEGSTCLEPQEVDHFLFQDTRANHLAVDSAEFVEKINIFVINEAQYKANEADLKSEVKNEKRNSQEFKDDAVNMRFKYAESQTKVKRRGGIIIGSVTINVVLIGIGAGIILLK